MSVLDLFFPRQVKCIFCGSETKEFGICDECYSGLPFILEPNCLRCGGKLTGRGKTCIECKNKETHLDRNYAILEYRDEVAHKIVNFKQNGVKHIGETFAYLIENKFKSIEENVDIIIPVPISNERLKLRGYNQSEILCNELISTGKVNTNILIRPEDTPHQTGLGRRHRLENLKDAFKVIDKKIIKGKTILLIDDIYTTGSTLGECARTLKKSGADRVISLTLARAVVNKDKLLSNIENTIDIKITNLAFDFNEIM